MALMNRPLESTRANCRSWKSAPLAMTDADSNARPSHDFIGKIVMLATWADTGRSFIRHKRRPDQRIPAFHVTGCLIASINSDTVVTETPTIKHKAIAVNGPHQNIPRIKPANAQGIETKTRMFSVAAPRKNARKTMQNQQADDRNGIQTRSSV